jgi:CDP-paratose 2-epimerase
MTIETMLVTGSGGLIGSEAVRHFASQGITVHGIDNDMRFRFFHDPGASTKSMIEDHKKRFGKRYIHHNTDIRDYKSIEKIFSKFGFDAIIHTAAQPSHDWPAVDAIRKNERSANPFLKLLDVSGPMTDFSVNQLGTLVLLEATRKFCPNAAFIYTSTNKVYGDMPNKLPLVELKTRWELSKEHPFFEGISESMELDMHQTGSLYKEHAPVVRSLFGVNKLGAESMVLEYGRNEELAGGKALKTAAFRGGCLTGPAHAGTKLHGFLAYLVKCIFNGTQYVVNGYKGKQVRDNIHCSDVISAFDAFIADPRPGEVYNIGGGRFSNTSMIEAIGFIEQVFGKKGHISFSDKNRTGDHIWYISDMSKFRKHYPGWIQQYDGQRILTEICEAVKLAN